VNFGRDASGILLLRTTNYELRTSHLKSTTFGSCLARLFIILMRVFIILMRVFTFVVYL
jgi:hypothetical protein